jgi:hypothetical protein
MLDPTRSHSPVPLDLDSIIAGDSQALAAGLQWPTHASEYEFLSTSLVDQVAKAARSAAITPELSAVVESKLYDLVTDLGVIARLALDIRNLRMSGRTAVYADRRSDWLRFLDQGGTDAGKVVTLGRWHHRKRQGTLSELKRLVRRTRSDALARFLPKQGRRDVLSRNVLLNETIAPDSGSQVDISPNYRQWPSGGETIAAVRGVETAVAEAFGRASRHVTEEDQSLAAAVHALAAPVITGHLARAWADLQQIRSVVGQSCAGELLVGGTPKHIGRLFGWHYQQLGRKVTRFAHGGERAFYDDYPWGLAELPFCDTYVCHSPAEARHIERRRAEARMAWAGQTGLEFTSLGSMKHRRIHARCQGGRTGVRTGTLMHVAGGYLGETFGDFPSRKPPDPVYFQWQVDLLSSLRAHGFRVVTKIHPKGLFSEAALLRPYSDEIVGGFFDPEAYDVDCYVFDFAGTAFFDALASNKGIVLADMGVRPIDPISFPDLGQRCEIVRARMGAGNRFEIDADALAEAVERASAARQWPDAFFSAYFGGNP